MQKRSHKLLASALLRGRQGFHAKRFEWAFLFGSFQPDCNPLTYLKGSWRARTLCGHNFSNSQRFISRKIRRLQARDSWNIWQYYTLGKLTHYLADAFTYPHNTHFPDGLMDHHRYETELRSYLAEYLEEEQPPQAESAGEDLMSTLEELHREYVSADEGGLDLDARYILEATSLLVGVCRPAVC